MPIFEYRCGSCGEVFELLKTASDNSPVYCPRCNSDNVAKLFSAFAGSSTGSGSGGCASHGGFS